MSLSVSLVFFWCLVLCCTWPVMCISTLCKPKGEWWNSALVQCMPCSKEPCHIGYYRETCTQGSTQNARCVPCSPPPSPNAKHISGGLPYTLNRCLWACNEGFYKDTEKNNGICVPCNTLPCDDPNLIRETCSSGSTRDAQCIPRKTVFNISNATESSINATESSINGTSVSD